MKFFSSVGIQSPEILIPNNRLDFNKWAVVACDQFTSQPEYWKIVEKTIGQSPSTYHLILPEAYLGTEKEQSHSSKINSLMENYLNNNYFQMIDGMIYIERFFDHSSRKGLIAALDLEQYVFTDGNRKVWIPPSTEKFKCDSSIVLRRGSHLVGADGKNFLVAQAASRAAWVPRIKAPGTAPVCLPFSMMTSPLTMVAI